MHSVSRKKTQCHCFLLHRTFFCLRCLFSMKRPPEKTFPKLGALLQKQEPFCDKGLRSKKSQKADADLVMCSKGLPGAPLASSPPGSSGGREALSASIQCSKQLALKVDFFRALPPLVKHPRRGVGVSRGESPLVVRVSRVARRYPDEKARCKHDKACPICLAVLGKSSALQVNLFTLFTLFRGLKSTERRGFTNLKDLEKRVN